MKRRDQRENHKRDQVLEQHYGRARHTVTTGYLIMVDEMLLNDGGRGHRDRAADECGLADGDCQQQMGYRGDCSRSQADRPRSKPQHGPAGGNETRHRELEANYEHQQGDAKFAEQMGTFTVRNGGSAIRPQHKAGGQVSDDRRQAQPSQQGNSEECCPNQEECLNKCVVHGKSAAVKAGAGACNAADVIFTRMGANYENRVLESTPSHRSSSARPNAGCMRALGGPPRWLGLKVENWQPHGVGNPRRWRLADPIARRNPVRRAARRENRQHHAARRDGSQVGGGSVQPASRVA